VSTKTNKIKIISAGPFNKKN